MKKKNLSLLLIVLTLCSIIGFTPNAYATMETNDNNIICNNETVINDYLVSSSPVISSQNFLLKYIGFKVYYTSDFSQFQYGNNCGPTLVANILSYYKNFGYSRLYSGDITQSMYNNIASIIGYTPEKGTHFGNVYKGVKAYAENAGYKFKHDVYLFDTWSDVTRDIKLGYPVIANDGEHGYFVVGYRIIDGVKQLFTCTGWDTPDYAWLNFDVAGFQMESVYIYE